MTCLGREGPRTRVLDIPKDACPQARSKAPRWRPGKSVLCACRGRAEAEAGRRGGHEAHSSGVGIPGEGPGPPRPLSSLRRQPCKALRTAHRRFPQPALRQNRGSAEALLVPAEGFLAHRSSSFFPKPTTQLMMAGLMGRNENNVIPSIEVFPKTKRYMLKS